MKNTSNLSNVDAFRFVNFHMVPTLAKVMEENNIKYVKPAAKTASSKKLDITFKIKIDGKIIEASPTIYYTDKDQIAISLHKMMYMKNIITIKDKKVYMVSVEKLLAVWNDPTIVSIDKRMYSDGIGEKCQMSRVNMSWFEKNADLVFEMSDSIYNEYSKKMKDMLVA